MNILDQFAVNSEALKDQTGAVKIVPNRVAHIDADFMAYIIAADTKKEVADGRLRSLEYKRTQIPEFASTVAAMAGAASYVLHITPTGSTKGGRYGQAVQREYQATRGSREPPAHLNAIRGYMLTDVPSVGHMDQEADDGMCQAIWQDGNNIVCSRDKDLRMCVGWHCNVDTGEHVRVEPNDFGWIALDDSTSTKKIVGYGPKFFFAQCLTGDTADNIQGLPAIPGPVLARWSPSAAYTKAQEGLRRATASGDQKLVRAAVQKLNIAQGKTKPCGPVAAFDLLNPVTSAKDAFALVKECFTTLGDFHEYDFVHWRTGEKVTPTQALLGDMRTLWMRRSKNPDDVLDFLRSAIS